MFSRIRALFSSAPSKRKAPPSKRKRGCEKLEVRENFAVAVSLAAGELTLRFDENLATGQSAIISSVNGKVTLNEKSIGIAAGAVKSITVVGSTQNNFIDLRFVSTATGFRGLDNRIVLSGRGGDDVLIGSQFGDKLEGGNGFDQLMAGAGNDTLDGGAGNDWLYPGYGNDIIFQSAVPDWCDILEPRDRVVRR